MLLLRPPNPENAKMRRAEVWCLSSHQTGKRVLSPGLKQKSKGRAKCHWHRLGNGGRGKRWKSRWKSTLARLSLFALSLACIIDGNFKTCPTIFYTFAGFTVALHLQKFRTTPQMSPQLPVVSLRLTLILMDQTYGNGDPWSWVSNVLII